MSISLPTGSGRTRTLKSAIHFLSLFVAYNHKISRALRTPTQTEIHRKRNGLRVWYLCRQFLVHLCRSPDSNREQGLSLLSNRNRIDFSFGWQIFQFEIEQNL